MNDYKDQYKDPRWQKKRLEIMERDGFACRFCESKDKMLNVHHTDYQKGKKIYDYPNHWLITLCEDCHKDLHFHIGLVKRSITTKGSFHAFRWFSRLVDVTGYLGEMEKFLEGFFDLQHKIAMKSIEEEAE